MRPPSRIKAILLCFLVTFIWSTSWILIKIGLRDIPAMTFAGLRYFLAFLCLLPFLFRKQVRRQVVSFSKSDWTLVILLGLISYFLAQGSQFISLSYLPATDLSLILNLTSLLVTFTAMVLIQEIPTWIQWVGLVLNLAGVFLFFQPLGFQGRSLPGFIFAIISLLANSVATLIGRKLNHQGRVDPLAVTLVSMGIGSSLLLTTGLIWQGLPRLDLLSIGIVVLLAVVNTAFTFTLWNYTLQTLTAMESSIIIGTMIVQITIFAWIFLGEKQELLALVGLVLAFVGAIVVNIKIERKKQLLHK